MGMIGIVLCFLIVFVAIASMIIRGIETKKRWLIAIPTILLAAIVIFIYSIFYGIPFGDNIAKAKITDYVKQVYGINHNNYLRTTEDNRIIIGGEDITFVPDIFNEKAATEKYSILEQRLKSMFKDIKDIEVEYKYAGAFASTKDNLGFLGPDPDNNKLWYCLGYGANGILFAILGGMMLSDLYLGIHNEDLSLFKVDRFKQCHPRGKWHVIDFKK